MSHTVCVVVPLLVLSPFMVVQGLRLNRRATSTRGAEVDCHHECSYFTMTIGNESRNFSYWEPNSGRWAYSSYEPLFARFDKYAGSHGSRDGVMDIHYVDDDDSWHFYCYWAKSAEWVTVATSTKTTDDNIACAHGWRNPIDNSPVNLTIVEYRYPEPDYEPGVPKLDYDKIFNNSLYKVESAEYNNTCPADTSVIATSETCMAAAEVLGLKYISNQSDPKYPPGCYTCMEKGSFWCHGHVYLNVHPEASPDWTRDITFKICKRNASTPQADFEGAEEKEEEELDQDARKYVDGEREDADAGELDDQDDERDDEDEGKSLDDLEPSQL